MEVIDCAAFTVRHLPVSSLQKIQGLWRRVGIGLLGIETPDRW
ncbi:hypothetical protein [Dulcicalothrix desertica]|nr:hypothetical protein [Dulcicalothrix desertica]